MSAPFRAQAYNRVVLLQTAAEWAETTDKVLQDYETGRETDTGYEKTGDGVSTWAELAYDDPTPTPGGVKVYRALLTQTGMDAPTATVLQNTLGGTVVWTYANDGTYIGTLVGAFPEGKVSQWSGVAGSGDNAERMYSVRRNDSDDEIVAYSMAGNTLSDGRLSSNYVEILVYP